MTRCRLRSASRRGARREAADRARRDEPLDDTDGAATAVSTVRCGDAGRPRGTAGDSGCVIWLSANCRKRPPSETTRSPAFKPRRDLVTVADPLTQRDLAPVVPSVRLARRTQTAGSPRPAARRPPGPAFPCAACCDSDRHTTYMSRLRMSWRFSTTTRTAVARVAVSTSAAT